MKLKALLRKFKSNNMKIEIYDINKKTYNIHMNIK